jgi:hypothetical protein
MKFFNSFIIAFFIINFSILKSFSIVIPQGTPINIVFPYTVDGGSLSDGASVVIEVSEDYLQDGKLIFKSGDKGSVTVDESEGKKLVLGSGYLKAVNGEKVKISLNKKAKGKGVVNNVSFWVGLILFWPALFFIRTKDAKISAGTISQAFLIQDIKM